MKLWDEHIAYLKDNPEGYWFKRKLYGYGWTPAKKEGWITVGVYLVFVLSLAIMTPADISESKIITHIVGPIVLATILLIVISWRTGEPLKWQWGQKHDK